MTFWLWFTTFCFSSLLQNNMMCITGDGRLLRCYHCDSCTTAGWSMNTVSCYLFWNMCDSFIHIFSLTVLPRGVAWRKRLWINQKRLHPVGSRGVSNHTESPRVTVCVSFPVQLDLDLLSFSALSSFIKVTGLTAVKALRPRFDDSLTCKCTQIRRCVHMHIQHDLLKNSKMSHVSLETKSCHTSRGF